MTTPDNPSDDLNRPGDLVSEQQTVSVRAKKNPQRTPDTGDLPAHSKSNLQIRFSPKTIARYLAMFVLLVTISGATARYVSHEVSPSADHSITKLMNRFDLGHEPSFPNWYSSVALFCCAVLLCVIAKARALANRKEIFYWLALACIFVFLAIDEAIMIHEMASKPLKHFLQTGGLLYFAWVIPWAIFVFCFGVVFLKFVLQLPSRTRLLFVLSGMLFVSGALGIELIEGFIFEQYGVASLQMTIAIAVEEFLEMIAIVIFLYALLDFIVTHVGIIQFAANDKIIPQGE